MEETGTLNGLEPQQAEEPSLFASLCLTHGSSGARGIVQSTSQEAGRTQHLCPCEVPPCTPFSPLSGPVLSAGGTLSFLWRPRRITDMDTILSLSLHLTVSEAAREGAAWVLCHVRYFHEYLLCVGQS